MIMRVHSVVSVGIGGVLIDIECSLSNNLPAIVIVGSASKAVDEARERVRAPFTASQLNLPRKRLTLNLAPADIPKSDSGLALAMASAILIATGQIQITQPDSTAFLGELGLDGSIRPIRGIIGKLLACRELGLTTVVIPTKNLEQARLVPGLTLLPANNLRGVYEHFANVSALETITSNASSGAVSTAMFPDRLQSTLDQIVGQAGAKRALKIAAAGGHNLLLSGPPGTGKTKLARALP